MCRAAFLLSLSLLLFASAAINAQQFPSLHDDLTELTNTVAVTGYESAVTTIIQRYLAAYHPQQDALGDITVTFGSGSPRRLLVASVDEPGYIVSKIDPDGFLRVQRLPQSGLPPHYNELQNAQPMVIATRDGRLLPAVTAGLSIHLQPGRSNMPDPDDIDNLYVDMGAANDEEVLHSGVDVLSPIAAERRLMHIGLTQWTGTAVGDRYGAAVLVQIARSLQTASLHGSVTLAFVVQQWAGSRGLTRILQQLQPDEMVYIGRPRAAPQGCATSSGSLRAETKPGLGSGVVVYDSQPGTQEQQSFLEQELERSGVQLHRAVAAPLLAKSFGPAISLPLRSLHIGVPLLWPMTAGETLDERDLTQLIQALAGYLRVQVPERAPPVSAAVAYAALPPRPLAAPSPAGILQTLSLTYGVSGQESMTRDAIEQLLPAWAHPTTDASGNLVLRLGSSTAAPDVLFIAHTDEIGFRIRDILPDGTLDLENKGGGSPAFYWGHPAIIHTSDGMRGGVVTLPEDYDTTQFHFPADFHASAKLYVGAENALAVSGLGIKVGDTVTIPKRFLQLLGRRVSIRSLDDRVGCAAMVRAVWDLKPGFKRNVAFLWSTREELGLEGASEFAATAAQAGQIPASVFAIDTFVSSDSPLESQRFADAKLGDGFVVRAIDSSNIAPWKDVQRLQAIASRHNIKVQYGVTGGGNDGSAFVRYGAISVPLSWPLRYSHSPAELIDLGDLDSLTSVTVALANEW
jgi:putative aminopeptidase